MYYVCTYKLGVMAHKTVSNDESHYTVWAGGISVAVRVGDRVGIDFIYIAEFGVPLTLAEDRGWIRD